MKNATKLELAGLALLAGLYVAGCSGKDNKQTASNEVITENPIGGIQMNVYQSSIDMKERTDEVRYFADQVRQDMQVLNDLQNQTIINAYKAKKALEDSLNTSGVTQ